MLNNSLPPNDWIVGFIDGDGYFGLEKVKRKRRGKVDLFYRPILAISQKDKTILYKIQSRIKCGTVSSKGKDQYHYRIRSADQFAEFFFPLIKRHFFQTNKQLQYDLLQKAVKFLTTAYDPSNKQDNQYLETIDRQLRETKKKTFVSSYPITMNWFIGFFEAEGTLYYSKTLWGPQRFTVKVTQKNEPLLEKIQKFFCCGKIHKERNDIYYFGFYNKEDLHHIYFVLKENGEKEKERVLWLLAYQQYLTN